MAILAMATADYRDKNLVTINYPGSFALSNTTARTGTYSYRANGGGGNIIFVKSFYGNIGPLYYRAGMQFVPNSTGYVHFLCDGVRDLTVLFLADGGIQARLGSAGGTLIASGTYTRTLDWQCLEFKLYVDDASGILEIKVDGILVLEFAGDTRYSSVSQLQNAIGFSTDGSNAYVDDIIVRDDDWPGRGGIYVLTPNAGSTTEEWTPSAGNPEDCVDEQPPDISDYISTDTSIHGTKQLFGITSLPITPSEIKGVGVLSTVVLDAPGTTYAMSIINSGGTKSSGNFFGLTSSSGVVDGYWDVDPADSLAWTNADIDALEVGIETVVL